MALALDFMVPNELWFSLRGALSPERRDRFDPQLIKYIPKHEALVSSCEI
jgi:hypothetical protein